MSHASELADEYLYKLNYMEREMKYIVHARNFSDDEMDRLKKICGLGDGFGYYNPWDLNFVMKYLGLYGYTSIHILAFLKLINEDFGVMTTSNAFIHDYRRFKARYEVTKLLKHLDLLEQEDKHMLYVGTHEVLPFTTELETKKEGLVEYSNWKFKIQMYADKRQSLEVAKEWLLGSNKSEELIYPYFQKGILVWNNN